MTAKQNLTAYFRSFQAVPHNRFGNERAWSVTGGTLNRGQIVHTHALSSSRTAVLKAIQQDEQEQSNG